MLVLSGAVDYTDKTTAKKVIVSLNSIISSGLLIDDLTLEALADYHNVDINLLSKAYICPYNVL